MARVFRTVFLMAFLLIAGKAYAAGGACPSGSNYTNPANPTGPNVSLASLGITNCYYVAASGSDANSGTSEASPWLHSPGMQQCQGNCASVSIAPGMGFIFRGGDTWHFGNSSASPYAGVVSNCSANGTLAGGLCLGSHNGTSANPIYYGVDQAWFVGGSWTRPILTADNPLCNANTANGTTCISTTDFYRQPSYYVTSCPYQLGNSNILADLSFSKYQIFDNFEMTGLCQNHTGQPGGDDTYVRYGAAQAPLYFTNLYIHGASHLKFAAFNGSPGCAGAVCINISAFEGSVNNGNVGETIVYNVVDFADSDPAGEELCQSGFYNVAYNAFRYTTQCLPNPLHVFHDNLYEHFFENGHSNLIESLDKSGTNAVYNNVFRHIENVLSSGGGVGLWLGPKTGTTDYIFNNVMFDVGPLEYINIGGVAITTVQGDYVFFNNTFQSNVSQPILRCHGQTQGTTVEVNNHYIDDQSYILGPCSALTATNALLMSNATAASKGYAASETYAYSPMSSTSPTVVAGTNAASSFCSALSTASTLDPYLRDAAWACANDTRYACTYNTSNHTVTCPTRAPAPRPTGVAWNIGAYQFGLGSSINPPSNLAAIVQ